MFFLEIINLYSSEKKKKKKSPPDKDSSIPVRLQHRHVQPLWVKTQVLVSVTLPFLNIPLSTRVYTSKKLKLIIPSPSSSRALKVSGTNRSKDLNSPLHRWELKLPPDRTRTHWRAAPSESGSTQSCQSRCAGPGCSGPRWSGAGGCWGRNLPTHNTHVTHGDAHLLVWDPLNHVLTSSLDSHPHLGGAHAAAFIHVSLFVDFLT